MSLAAGAAYYASIGWKIFPCFGIVDGKCECGDPKYHKEPKDYGKHPRVSAWQDEATDDAATVADWWDRWPQSNMGVFCKGSGFAVVDVDPRNGGLEAWEKLETLTSGAFPDTVRARTGVYDLRGGRSARGEHHFLTVPEGMTLQGKIKGLDGIDIKHNGYVLINPSRHASGVSYEWVPGRAPWEIGMAPAPEELLGLIRKSGGGGGGGGGGFGLLEWDGEKIDIDALVAAGIRSGERATTLFKITCAVANTIEPKMLKTEMGRQTVRWMVKEINSKACHPPMSWGDGDSDDFSKQCENAIDWIIENPKGRAAARALEPALVAWAEGIKKEPPTAAPVTVKTSAGPGTAVLGPVAMSLPLNPDAVDEAAGGTVGHRSMTDLGNGRRVVDYIGWKVRFTPSVGWHMWNGEYWVPDVDGGRVFEETKDLPIWIGSELAEMEMEDPKYDDLLKWSHRARTLGMRKNAVTDARTDRRIQVGVSQWDANPYVLGVKNGVIDLKTGTLLTPDPDLFITRQSKVAYTPGMRNVKWEEFLDFATGGDKELQRYMQMAAGYTLTGDRSHECLFLIYGPPGSGKSTFLEVIGTLLGDYYLPMDSDVLVETIGAKASTEYHMAQLMGRRMIGISEWPEGRQTKEDAIKRLTGDTLITGRHPGERPFTFASQAKLWIGTNVKPRISERAMWRRIRAINFSHVPERPDPDLKSYLLDPEGALPAVLSWAVEGAVKLLGSRERMPLGLGASAHVRDATREYEISEDKFGMFMAEEMREMTGAETRVMDIYKIYKMWIEERGEHVPSIQTVNRILEEKGMKLVGTGNVSVLHGWALRPRAVATPAAVEWTGLVEASKK